MKFIESTVKAHELMKDDRFKLAGTMYQINSVETQHGYSGEKIYIVAFPLKGHETFDRLALHVKPHQLFKVYNQK